MAYSVFVIRGGHGGIGKVVVRYLLKKGVKVVVLDVNDINSSKIKSDENYMFIKTDVTNIDELKRAHDIMNVWFYESNFK